jgi:hypothetical protein
LQSTPHFVLFGIYILLRVKVSEQHTPFDSQAVSVDQVSITTADLDLFASQTNAIQPVQQKEQYALLPQQLPEAQKELILAKPPTKVEQTSSSEYAIPVQPPPQASNSPPQNQYAPLQRAQ